MNEDLAFLLSAAIVFIGGHILMSHPLRALIVKAIGEIGFMIAYSVIALGSLWLMIHAFTLSPSGPLLWDGYAPAPWIVGSVLTIVAMVLLLGSFVRNPSLPHPGAGEMAQNREAVGVFAVTRHPMMWSFAIWALAHVIVSPNGRTILFAGAIAFLALVGAALQDGKKRAALGADWQAWETRTRYWPDLTALLRIDWKLWAIAAIVWFAATWAHLWWAMIPAGIWRWIV